MLDIKNGQALQEFYNDFIYSSRKRLSSLLEDKNIEDVKFLKSNLEVCIKNYGLVTAISERLLSMRGDREMLSKLKIEYKYHDPGAIEKAYFNSIDYIERFYHGIAEDFIEKLNSKSSLTEIYNCEVEFNSMLYSFMHDYSQVVDSAYIPSLKVII